MHIHGRLFGVRRDPIVVTGAARVLGSDSSALVRKSMVACSSRRYWFVRRRIALGLVGQMVE